MKIEAIRKEKEIAAESMLRTQFKMELLVYTQDSTYSKKLGKRKREEMQNYTSTSPSYSPTSPSCSPTSLPFNRSTLSNDSGGTLREMVKHLKTYYKIAGRRLADQIPLVIRYQVLQQSVNQLQREMLQMFQDKKITECLLQEDPGIKNQRIHLQTRLKRLSAARNLLTEFSLNTYNFNKGRKTEPNAGKNTTAQPLPPTHIPECKTKKKKKF
ncbi:interferon-induced GTP-binding protein Mx-like [Pseudoliparis swirei]|uniref:interferon-induced GTP-binding protein Mx-like n=1 Tax=Pseudoliparis swirei TaxID=2059687 RepID=UPI0024BEFCCD|nr:interferon-induced GTP-binding protein Mx-like [Pseudoliparis swirei]